MKIRFSDKMHHILDLAVEETLRTGHGRADVDHLMLGLLRDRDSNACRALCLMKLDLDDMKRSLDEAVFLSEPVKFDELESIHPTRDAVEVIRMSVLEALRNDCSTVRDEHLLLAIAIFPRSASRNYLMEHGISAESLETFLMEKGMLREDAEHESVTIAPEVLRALGEQLGNLFSSSDLSS